MEQPAYNLAHLHVHSEYSLVDGAIRINDLVSKAKELGHTAVALTDHGALFGAVEFYLAAKGAGIKPILGAEIYHASLLDQAPQKKPSVYNMVLLARSNKGYHNLVKVVSAGYLRGLESPVPLVPGQDVLGLGEEQICVLSCHNSEFSVLTSALRRAVGAGASLDSDHESAQQIWTKLHQLRDTLVSTFGAEHVYVEITDNNIPAQKQLIGDLVHVAQKLALPLVASANAHYLNAEDSYAHTALLAIKNDLKLSQVRNRRKNARAHLFSNEEMIALYSAWPEALHNTGKIAAACDVSFTFGEYFLPKFELPSGENSEEALKRLAHEGLEKRFEMLRPQYGESFGEKEQQAYRERLDYELGVIISMGFPGYFLIVQDFINWAKEQGIPVGPGRGSGAGSLVAYSLRITDLDPIPYNLIFERFLNPDRVSMPDFDVDFCQDRRDEVIDYVSRRYGDENVAQITTFGKMLAKAVVRDVGRVLNLSYGKVDRIAKLIPNELGIKLQDAIDREPRIRQEAAKDPLIEDLLSLALQLEGLSRHTSVHAAGLVISDGAMQNYVPVYRDDAGSLITQFEMKNAEKVGLVKFDFLGLKTLTVIDKAVKIIRASKDPDFCIETIPLEDRRVYSLISTGLSTGVFQLESTGMQKLLMKLQPSKFEDVIALVALFRPGPLQSGMVDDFVERKHGRQDIVYQLPQLEPILADTYGIILYQEQVQKVASVLASYTLGEADLLRRAMGKKKPEEMAKQKTRFVEGCHKNGIDEKMSTDIFDLMAKFAEYGFNKSHSAAYGLVSYQTAYLKTHYPEEYMAAIMTCDIDNTDKVVKYIQECRRLRIKVLPPDINRSLLEFDVVADKTVGFGLAGIKGIGSGSLEAIVAARQEKGPFANLSDLAKRVNLHKVGKKTLELLTLAGAMDTFGIHRGALLGAIGELVKYSENHHSAKAIGQGMLFGEESSDDASEDAIDQFADLKKPFERQQLKEQARRANHWLLEEKRLLGVFLSGHPLDLFKSDAAMFGQARLTELPKYAGKSEVRCVALLADAFERPTKDGKRMLMLRLEDQDEQVSIAVFDSDQTVDDLPPPNTPVVCQLKVQKAFDGGPPRIRLGDIQTLELFRKKRIRHVEIGLPAQFGDSSKPAAASQHLYQSFQATCIPRAGATKASITLKYPKAQLKIEPDELSIDLTDEFIQAIQDLREIDRAVSLDYR